MPTQEVLNQWEASSPTTKSEGPLQGTSNRSSPLRILFIPPTNLTLLKLPSLWYLNTSALPRDPTQKYARLVTMDVLHSIRYYSPKIWRRETKRFQQDRVRNSGARTPGSIHADIVAQIEAKRERKASEEAEKDKKKDEIEEKST
ncbi:hypothetical protein FAGAP_3511 [Fusarium agapanthi]|uniref:Uncharacterized protein n=1 Tax=Fusarium agapanthi TaxID=1803897 RepID=A0A9P5BF60_9HYPO|nr:hypothetical protein FAGAP_3511 [Fusarium agapanthi]